ncbi:MAG: G8 domain-containing protein, partial [Flavobacteriales bacterium]
MNTRTPDLSGSTRTPWRTRIAAMTAGLALAVSASAQTTLIDPAGDGGFENGATFAANGWSVSNGTNGPWEVGSLYSASTPFSGNSAYISADGGITSSYDPSLPATSFFWRDVTVPAGETFINLTFDWHQIGESSWDIWQVWFAPTSVTPSGTNAHPGAGTNGPVPPSIAGATFIGNGSAAGCAPTIQTATFTLPGSLAGTTFRLIFSWKQDTSVGGTCPAAIDNISLESDLPSTYTAAVPGGLWNSPDSWVGGVVPPGGSNVVIPAGSTIVVNQTVSLSDLTVNGKLQWVTSPVPSSSVNTLSAINITVGTTGQFLAHGPSGTGTATTGGATINIYGDFINNGFSNLAAGGTAMWFLASGGFQTLGGTGTFMADKAGRGMIPNLLFATAATCTLSTAS